MGRKVIGSNIEPKNLRPIERLNQVLQGEVISERQSLEGRLLTIVDAAFADVQQREAFKSLIRGAVWDSRIHISGILEQFTQKFPELNLGEFKAYDNYDHMPTPNYFRD